MYTARTYRTNRGLFSNDYLDERLPETEAWDELDDDELREARADIDELWERERGTARERSEPRLEETFVRPMFRRLGLPFEAEKNTERTQRRPDYALFESAEAAREASERDEFYEDAVAVADAKRWGRPLDARGSDGHDDFEHPSYRMHVYLQETPARWAILTDGKRWRLYHGPTSHRLDSYYEVDLPTLLEAGDSEAFRYFYLFFRHEAFLEDADGDCFLDAVYRDSNAVARKLRADLQDNVYEAVETLSNGFLQHPDNDLTATDLGRIHDAALVYLYRLVFLLYAESADRDPLDTTDGEQASYGLNSLAQAVEADPGGPSPTDHDLWSRLDERFELVGRGRESRDGPADLDVPAYDGGLFRTDPDEGDAPEAQFLAEHRVGDAHLAEVIELLTRRRHGRETEFVDYASLSVRYLGSLYEGLLEHEPDVAHEPLARAEGEYVRADDGDEVVVREGEVYLPADRGERKATGSYYTPERIVEYIVEHTLGPLVEDIRADLAGQRAGDGEFAAEFAERVFDLTVLDPAMGSGHFLTSAVDYLAREIVDAQGRQAARQGVETVDEEHDIDWARRQVARRCIYGVDRDPLAVELAKASLWLRTLATDRPLGSLDHHLKTGDALVGGAIEELESEASGERSATLVDAGVAPEAPVERSLRTYRNVVAETRGPAGGKEAAAKADEFELRRRLRGLANVHTAERFGLDALPDDACERTAAALRDDERWNDVERAEWFRDAQARAETDRYFHWRLEFPEVYYAEGGTREEGGFDAVIGNPPWVATAGRADVSANTDADLRSYLGRTFATTENQFDLYVAFYEQAIRQSRTGRVGVVVPDAVLTREQNEPIREFVLSHTSLAEVVRIGAAFEGVETGAVVLVSGGGGERVRCADATTLQSLDYDRIPRRVFETEEAKRFLIYLDEETRSILAKVADRPPLDEYADISRGEEIGKRADCLFERRRTTTRPIAPGGAIARYGVDEDAVRHIRRRDIKKADRQYESPKLIFRQTGESLVGTFDADDVVTIKSAYNIRGRTDSVDELKHILGVLNSAVLNFYHRYKHAAYRSVFPQINQSTFEAFPVAVDGGPDETLVDAVDERLDVTAERSDIDLRIEDYLGDYEFGPPIRDRPECRPVDGVSATKLAATTRERPNLRIGTVDVETTDRATVLTATARYKPTGRAVSTDRWGYAETDPIPAVAFVDPCDEREALLEAFVPHATERAGGFAGFRETATTSKSLYDRLRGLQLPRLGDVADGLNRFVDDRDRARELDDRREALRRTIDERVCALYELTDAEQAVIRSEFDG